jgi:hypothetical protein
MAGSATSSMRPASTKGSPSGARARGASITRRAAGPPACAQAGTEARRGAGRSFPEGKRHVAARQIPLPRFDVVGRRHFARCGRVVVEAGELNRRPDERDRHRLAAWTRVALNDSGRRGFRSAAARGNGVAAAAARSARRHVPAPRSSDVARGREGSGVAPVAAGYCAVDAEVRHGLTLTRRRLGKPGRCLYGSAQQSVRLS